ncbi:MAG: UDP-N-acetylmuramoyl-L-alanine--D-glutamate ligase [Firmicutes bacterium]|nr:UDP-N-acetylmuramoyl-L-alanine--D-glutamate ligase [Bacillota bacterium]
MELRNKTVLIIGMARSGIAAAKTLLELNCRVILNDSKPEQELTGLEELKGRCEFRLGCRADGLLEGVDYIVISPSVPPTIPALKSAAEKGIPVLTEIELGYRLCSGTTVAITGTNGKTTTTSLVGQMFQDAGRKNFVVGNIGVPYVSKALNAAKEHVMVTEISSYQLQCIDTFHAHVALLLNITPDHLDRHGGMDGYIAAKRRVFENQNGDDFAVLNYEDKTVRAMADKIKSRAVFFSSARELEQGVFLKDGNIVFKYGAVNTVICPAGEVYIKGRHNLENAMAAVAAAMLMGISAQSCAYTLRSFKGVEHRIETVDTVKGVTFINDSKGTNPDSTVKAIQTMTAPTVLLLGGYDKGGSFDGLIKQYTPYIRYTVVLGATKDKITAALEACGVTDYCTADTFRDAVMLAYSHAEPGWNVLLSPACASWDMFKDFEQRGEVFKQIVGQIKEQG